MQAIYKAIIVIFLILSACTIRKDTKKELPTFHPKTYYNQYRPKFSPFETYEMPTIENDRGSQYRKKMKHKVDYNMS